MWETIDSMVQQEHEQTIVRKKSFRSYMGHTKAVKNKKLNRFYLNLINLVMYRDIQLKLLNIM